MEVSVRPGNYAIKQGESVKVDVTVTQGVVPKTIGIQTKKPSATEWTDPIPMEPNDGGYVYTFEDVQDSFEYKLNVNAEGTGPFLIAVTPRSTEYKSGRKAGKDYLNGDLTDYRLVIMLRALKEARRDEFIEGFISVFAEEGLHDKGQRYAKIISGALAGDVYEPAYEYGTKHVNDQITDVQIQELIRRSLGVSGSVALGWKAGYIHGFMREMARKKVPGHYVVNEQEKGEFYKQAEAMYEALRAATGL